jgi:hypothetical protein
MERTSVRNWRTFLLSLVCILLVSLRASAAGTNEQRSLVIIVGAPGTEEFAEQFTKSADLWKKAGARAGMITTVIGEEKQNPEDDLRRLTTTLTNELNRAKSELWLVFIGHGTFDGKTAKFNLRGPDISAEEAGKILKPCERPMAIIQCASSSAPFMNALAATNRVIITATKSGHEMNSTRFGNFMAAAIGDPAADIDRDGQTSLLEAFLMAASQTDQFYKEAGRLATEHPLIDDNGDGLGTPPDWFKGVRATKGAADGKAVDGARAHQMNLIYSPLEQELSDAQRIRRNELELQLNALRNRKTEMKEDDYYNALEKILLETARIYGK